MATISKFYFLMTLGYIHYTPKYKKDISDTGVRVRERKKNTRGKKGRVILVDFTRSHVIMQMY